MHKKFGKPQKCSGFSNCTKLSLIPLWRYPLILGVPYGREKWMRMKQRQD